MPKQRLVRPLSSSWGVLAETVGLPVERIYGTYRVTKDTYDRLVDFCVYIRRMSPAGTLYRSRWEELASQPFFQELLKTFLEGGLDTEIQTKRVQALLTELRFSLELAEQKRGDRG